jgi:hypothetical protein
MLHLNKFLDRLQGLEARNTKDFVMPIADAKGLHNDITRLLLELHDLREQADKIPQQEVITVRMDGGSF